MNHNKQYTDISDKFTFINADSKLKRFTSVEPILNTALD